MYRRITPEFANLIWPRNPCALEKFRGAPDKIFTYEDKKLYHK